MMEIKLRLPKPHSEEQEKIVKAFVTPHLKELWVSCGTKFGKTISAAEAFALKMPIKKQGVFRWVAPTYSQAFIGLRYVERMLPPPPYTKPGQYILRMPGIGSRLEFRSGEKPENLEGEGVHGYVLDEAAKLREEVYSSAKTTTTQTGGPIIAVSTPRGKNFFYKKCMDAKDEMEYCIRNNLPITKMFLTAPTSANPYVSKEAIEESRRNMPFRLFRQYYLAEFMDDANVFTGFTKQLFGEELTFDEERHFWVEKDCKKSTVVIGADWAKTNDWTVFIAIDIATRKVIGFERFHKRTYTEAIRQLVRFSHNFGTTEMVYHDKTGVGMAIDDQMAYTDLAYQGIIFSNQSKSEMVNRLITTIEQGRITIPRWNILIRELDNFEVSTTKMGAMCYAAPGGQHDDAVCALLLAHAALLQYGEADMEVKFLEDLTSKKNQDKDPTDSLESYYQSLKDDDDDD